MSLKKSMVVKVLSVGLFTACLIGFLVQSYDCFSKFSSFPEAMEVKLKPQNEVDFPVISFCPLPMHLSSNLWSNPLPMNKTKLDNCGIDFTKGEFNGSSIDCRDPEILWSQVLPKFEDFGYIDGLAQTFLYENHKIPTKDWKRMPTGYCGACYSMALSRKIVEMGVSSLHFNIESDKNFNIFLHSEGLLNPWNPLRSLEYGKKLITRQKSYSIQVTYQQDIALKFESKKCLQKDEYIGYSQCIQDNIEKVSDNFGCTTPFENNLGNICTNKTKGKRALELYYQNELNSTCLYPCRYLSTFTFSTDDKIIKNGSRQVHIVFKDYVKENASKYTYTGVDLFAAIGGYIGLFLGFSMFQIKDAIGYIMERFQCK